MGFTYRIYICTYNYITMVVPLSPVSHGSAVSRRKIVKLDLRASHANWRWLLMGMKMQFSKWTTYFLEALWGGMNYFTIFSIRKGFLIKSVKVPLIKTLWVGREKRSKLVKQNHEFFGKSQHSLRYVDIQSTYFKSKVQF